MCSGTTLALNLCIRLIDFCVKTSVKPLDQTKKTSLCVKSAFVFKWKTQWFGQYAAVSLSDLCQWFISVITCQRLCRNSGDFAVDRWFADDQKILGFCRYTVDYRRFDVGVRPLSFIGYVGVWRNCLLGVSQSATSICLLWSTTANVLHSWGNLNSALDQLIYINFTKRFCYTT